MESKIPDLVIMDDIEVFEDGFSLPAAEVAEKFKPVERPANRAERRAFIKTLDRKTRIAYGFGRKRFGDPPGFFHPPALPREDVK